MKGILPRVCVAHRGLNVIASGAILQRKEGVQQQASVREV